MNEAIIFLTLVIAVALFHGEPDLIDALIIYLSTCN